MQITADAPNGVKPGTTRLTWYQYQIFCICFVTILVDGFDTQAAAFAGPLLKRAFGADSQALGLIFGASLFGGLAGGLLLGPLGDRKGRRPVLLSALLLIALGSLATALAHNEHQIMALRFLTGLGLGGAVPSVIALSAEYAPPRYRSTVVAMVFNGFPLGAVLGSILAAYVLPLWGWRVLFGIGGALPVIILVLALPGLPESLQILKRSKQRHRLNKLVRRLGPQADALLADEPDHDLPRTRGSVVQLFTNGLASVTLLIWLICFLSLLTVYCIINWLPTLAAEAGLPLRTAVLAIGAINIGSIIGNFALARIGDRMAPHLPTGCAYALGAVFIALIGSATSSTLLMLSVCFAAGVFCVGAQLSVTAIIARLYPTPFRATGVGWSFGLGRLGGVVGPVLAGILLTSGFGLFRLMMAAGALSLATGAAVVLLGRRRAVMERAQYPSTELI